MSGPYQVDVKVVQGGSAVGKSDIRQPANQAVLQIPSNQSPAHTSTAPEQSSISGGRITILDFPFNISPHFFCECVCVCVWISTLDTSLRGRRNGGRERRETFGPNGKSQSSCCLTLSLRRSACTVNLPSAHIHTAIKTDNCIDTAAECVCV